MRKKKGKPLLTPLLGLRPAGLPRVPKIVHGPDDGVQDGTDGLHDDDRHDGHVGTTPNHTVGLRLLSVPHHSSLL